MDCNTVGINSEYDNYWEQFGKNIAAPVILAFCKWIESIVTTDEKYSDIIFVARDGYWPYTYFSDYSKICNNVNIHYIYAPRSIVMTNSEKDYKDYNNYIKKQKFGKSEILVVDTITSRFSAQKLLGRFIDNKITGLYWTVTLSAKDIAKKDCLEYFTFQGEYAEIVPCWALMEFIFSAPERPIKAIRDGKVVHYNGNTFEDERLIIIKKISIGVREYFQSRKVFNDVSYINTVNLLRDFYYSPSIYDLHYFKRVIVSDYPDHSDNLKVKWFASQDEVNSVNNEVGKKRYCSKILGRITRLEKRILKEFRIYRGSSKHLSKRLSSYDVVSFDVFDTLVYRDCEKPKDIFLRLEEKNGLFDFAKTRSYAERKAENFYSNKREIDISDIYSVLEHFYGDNIPKSAAEDEINEELIACYANPYMKEVYNYCRQNGISIIAVSDMYLHAETISKILKSCGYEIEQIFVSCDMNEVKRTGRLQRKVWETIGIDKAVVHIGDDYYADYLGSKKNGWNAILIPKEVGK